MSQERTVALEMALKAVFATARDMGVPFQHLSDATIDRLSRYRAQDAVHVPIAIHEMQLLTDVFRQQAR
jgi:hypothetical protein